MRLPRAVLVASLTLLAALALPTAASATQTHYYANQTLGAGQLSLRTPGSGVAVNDTTGDVYVADGEHHRVAVYSSTGTFLEAFGWGVTNGNSEFQICHASCQEGISGTQPGQFVHPEFIAVDNSQGGTEDIYVMDETEGIVTRFDSEGHLDPTWGEGGQMREVPAAEGTGDITPSTGAGSGTLTLGSNLITSVQTSSGAFEVGQLVHFGSLGSCTPSASEFARIAAVSASVVTLSKPVTGICLNNGATSVANAPFVGEKTTVSNLVTTKGQFVPARRVLVEGLPQESAILEATASTLVLSKAAAAPKSAAALSTTASPFDEPRGLAVGPDGHVYVFVFSAGSEVLDLLPSGAIVRRVQIGGSKPAGIGVGGDGTIYLSEGIGNIERLNLEGERIGFIGLRESEHPVGIAVSLADESLYVGRGGVSLSGYRSTCLCSFQTFGEGLLDEGAGLAINSKTGTIYAASTGDDRVLIFPVAIEASAEAATGVTAHTATLNGKINPEGSALSACRFEYGEENAEGQNSVPCAESLAGIGSGTSPVSVHADISGLEGGTHYQFRLRATNGQGDVKSDEVPLITSPSPAIESTKASEITATSAKLEAKINPRGSPTAYRFEYGACTTPSSCASSPYEHSIPVPDEAIGAGASGVEVSQRIEGLQPEATYHFRVIAHNSAGTITGTEHTFTFLSGAPIETGCSNEAIRQGNNSTTLPDCRAYELVSPAKKNGTLVGGLLFGRTQPLIAPDGQSMFVNALQCFAATPSCLAHRSSEGELYEFARTASGWQTIPLAPPADAFQTHTWLSFGGARGDMIFSVVPAEGPEREAFYARLPDGTVREIGPVGEGEEALFPQIERLMSTTDFSHVLFHTLSVPVWAFNPGEASQALYEYSGFEQPEPQLVGVTGGIGSRDLISACGTGLGTTKAGATPNQYNSLSSDGRQVFFSASQCAGGTGSNAGTPVPANLLYTRIDSERTVEISAPVSSSCTTTECEGAPARMAAFEGASADGTLAYFTSTGQLTDEASQDPFTNDFANSCASAQPTASGCNLYLSVCPSHCAEPAERQLIDVSAGAKASGGPKVQGMMALSPDGTHAYFVAKGVLTEAPNALGEEAVEGAANVYLYEHDEAHPQGRLSFVTRLAPSDFSDWQEGANGQGIGLPNITPDGRFTLFTSHRALVPGAASGAAQVYRYDAAGEAMTRVSIGQRGFNDDGNSAQLDATIVRAQSEIDNNIGPPKANPSISDDGRFVFFQSPVGLTPGALNEVKVSSGEPTEYAENVYEWEQEGAGGCHEAGGCVSLLTDGTEASEGGVVQVYNPELLGTDASGENVFIAAIHQLTWQDTDTQRDYYDLRVGGGFARPEEALPCQGDVCKGEGSKPAAAPSPATPNFSGPEEGPKHPQKLKKSKHKKKQHKKKQHRKLNRTGGKK